MITLAFFNNQGGVGKTSLVYHLAWMYADLGLRVVAADLDPQADLSAMFLDEARLDEVWPLEGDQQTVLQPIRPLFEGVGGLETPHVEDVGDIGLLIGDLALSGFEDELSRQWSCCLEGKARAFRVMAAFHEIIARASEAREADIVLIDVGPNLGAINRAALIAADHVAIPLAPDLFSVKGMQDFGPQLQEWREGWAQRAQKAPPDVQLPLGEMRPLGYVVMPHAVRLDRTVRAYARWLDRIPRVFRESVQSEVTDTVPPVSEDPWCLGFLKHYRSLMPLAMEARKPMFHLKPADGAIGGHSASVQGCYQDFRDLAMKLAERCGVTVS